MKNYFGCSGWQYDDWKGKFYPEKLPKKNWLKYYCEHFNSVEVNASFYHLPQKSTLEKWHEESCYPFKFTLKGSRYITHIKRLKEVDDALTTFYDRAILLGNKLGCILWQFPPNMKADAELLVNFCDELSPEFKNVIEFRHESWFNETYYAILKKHHVGFCILSARHMPEVLITTTKNAYVRFHGLGENWYNYNYSKNELEDWSHKIETLNASEAYVYFNNDVNANAPRNCLTLKELETVESHW